MSGAVNDVDRRLRRAWRWLFWLSLAFVAVVALVQERHRAAMAAFQQIQQVGTPASRAAEAKFRTDEQADEGLLGIRDPVTGRWRTRTRDELAQSLFGGRMPTTLPSRPGGDTVFIDEARGVAFHMGFNDDGTLSSYSLGPLPVVPPQEPWLMRALRDVDPLRRKWVGSFTAFTIGPMLWIALFVATIVWKPARLPLAYAQLAVAWLCFLGWLIKPQSSIRGFFSNDMLFWGTLMVVASWFALWIVRDSLAAAADAQTLCRACGYDLTGNVSGVCPECGTATDARRAAAETSPA
jgi:hypothetical protein